MISTSTQMMIPISLPIVLTRKRASLSTLDSRSTVRKTSSANRMR